MLKIIKSNEVLSADDLRSAYSGCLVLANNYDYDKFCGCAYAISTDPSSMDDLLALQEELDKAGEHTALLGVYKGDYVGVQHIS